MTVFRPSGLLAAGLLLALAAAAQTPATPRAKRTPAGGSLRSPSPKSTGNNVYAAPGEPVIVRDSGKPLHYDGPAAGHAAKAAAATKADKPTAMPNKQ